MTTMLDKAAEALCARTEGRDDVWPDLSIRERDGFRDLARAALQAIRVPSDEMLAPACRTHRPGEPMSEARPEECPAISRRRARYTAMIDAILEGKD